MSIWLADVNGRVVKAIVNKDLQLFLKRVRQHSPLILSLINILCLDFHSFLVRYTILYSEFGARVRAEDASPCI